MSGDGSLGGGFDSICGGISGITVGGISVEILGIAVLGVSNGEADCSSAPEVLLWLSAGFGAKAPATIIAAVNARRVATSFLLKLIKGF